MKLKVTPTAVKGWFQFRCERKFIYETMDREIYRQIPIHEQAVSTAWADEGNDYEQRIVGEMERRSPGSILLPRAVDRGSLTSAASHRFLRRDDPKHQFAHQLLLGSSPTLANRLQLSNDLEIKNGKVDLVQVVEEGGQPPRFRIIDIKATQVATLFHKAQVAFYALMLESTLAELGIPGAVDEQGEIWHRTQPGGAQWEAEPFQVRSYMRLVEDFFQRRAAELTRFEVTAEGSDETPFHIYFKCEQCKFLGHCQRQIADDVPADELDLSAIAGLTQQSKRTLRGLGIATVGDFIRKEGALHGQDDWTLRTRGWTLNRRARSLSAGQVQRLVGQYSLHMPPQVDRPIYLLADSDPVDGRLATLGCLVVGDEGRQEFHVRVIGENEHEASALIDILGVVLVTLSQVDRWNSEHGGDPRHTHIFTYEPSEAADLQEAIGRHLNSAQIRRGLLDLVRIFPPDQVMPEPDYRGFHHLPASALRTILTDLFAFPVKVSNDLHRVSRALKQCGSDLEVAYTPSPDFSRPFSSRLSIELCRRLGDPAVRALVEADIRQRLETMHGLALWLYKQNGAVSEGDRFLRLRKKPFRFRQQFNPLAADDLDVLQAQCLLTSRAALLQALVELARPAAQRRDRLNCYADLILVDDQQDRRGNLNLTFDVPTTSRHAELAANDLGIILSDGSPDLILNPDLWPGLQASLLPQDGARGQIRVKVWSGAAEMGLIPMLLKKKTTRWFLDRVFVDLNATKLTAFLTFLAQGS